MKIEDEDRFDQCQFSYAAYNTLLQLRLTMGIACACINSDFHILHTIDSEWPWVLLAHVCATGDQCCSWKNRKLQSGWFCQLTVNGHSTQFFNLTDIATPRTVKCSGFWALHPIIWNNANPVSFGSSPNSSEEKWYLLPFKGIFYDFGAEIYLLQTLCCAKEYSIRAE